MAMPEAAVNKDHRAVPGQLEIGAAGEVATVGPETEAAGKEALADEELGPGVGAVDTGHHAAAGSTGNIVHDIATSSSILAVFECRHSRLPSFATQQKGSLMLHFLDQ